MIAAYFLVILFDRTAVPLLEKIPMQSIEACMTAKNLVIDNGIADKAICVPTGEK